MGEQTVFCDCSTCKKGRPLHEDYVPFLFKMKNTLRLKTDR